MDEISSRPFFAKASTRTSSLTCSDWHAVLRPGQLTSQFVYALSRDMMLEERSKDVCITTQGYLAPSPAFSPSHATFVEETTNNASSSELYLRRLRLLL